MKIGLYGGSFDPIHLGHLITAQSVLEKRKLDKIIFMPCFISPHKLDFNYISALHRFTMIKIAIEAVENFVVSDFEIKREEVSYTIDTVMELKKIFDSIELIIGYDNLIVFDKWKEPEKLIQNVQLVVMNRKSFGNDEKRNIYFDKAVFVDTPRIEISSTEIRERVKHGLDIRFLVGEKVNRYIIENNLYK